MRSIPYSSIHLMDKHLHKNKITTIFHFQFKISEHHLKNAVPVYVGNLPNNIKRLKLVKLFKQYGKIISIRLRTNSGKGFLKKSQAKNAPFLIAFIYFETREAAEASLACNGTQIGDNTIHVDLDADKRVEQNRQPQLNTVVVGNLKYGMVYHIYALIAYFLNIFCNLHI